MYIYIRTYTWISANTKKKSGGWDLVHLSGTSEDRATLPKTVSSPLCLNPLRLGQDMCMGGRNGRGTVVRHGRIFEKLTQDDAKTTQWGKGLRASQSRTMSG